MLGSAHRGLVMFLCAGVSAFTATAQSYRISDLDGNGVLSLGAAFGISEAGTAVGLGNPLVAPDTRGVTWTNHISTILPVLPGHELSEAYDVSEAGVVGGTSLDVMQVGQLIIATPYAVVWQNGNPIELSTLVTGGANLELHRVRRLNERGLILGEGRDASALALRAFTLESGIVTDLGALSATGSTAPFDLNELGQVVGCSGAARGVDHAFLWQNGVMTDLHDPTVIFGRCSTARAVNASGVIVGSADFINNGLQWETATVWRNGTITNLGTLAGNQSYARDVNDHGTIVGTTTWQGNGVHAFICRRGVMEDLNNLVPPGSGWTLANAHAITNDGRIVGEGFHNGLRPFLLEPDGCGGFLVYGAGCAGSGGFTPRLWGAGCAASEGVVSLAVTAGTGGANGALLFGSGNGSLTVLPGCDLQILPLFPVSLPLSLGGTGAGAGHWQIAFPIARGTPPFSLFLQSAFVDPSGPSLSNALRMDVQ